MQRNVVIVGAAIARIAATTCLARAQRPFCVIGAGQPRSRFFGVRHGFFGVYAAGNIGRAPLGVSRARIVSRQERLHVARWSLAERWT